MLVLFNNLTLDTQRRELRAGDAAIAIEPQVFDLVVYLIENRDRVVSKDDLIASVWAGRIVSDSTLDSRINAARKAIGDSGKEQRLIRTVARKGVRFVGEVHEADKPQDTHVRRASAPLPSSRPSQTISFCRASDGVNIAMASAGAGPILLKTANWLNHLEYDWLSPIWFPMYSRLAARFQLVRYDGRGNGLSDWNVPDISFAGFERDLDAVAATLAAQRFILLGFSQGAANAISYAVRQPHRVAGLILYGGYAQGRNRRNSLDDLETAQAFLSIMRQGWGEEDSAFLRAFSSLYLPNGSREQIKWYADLQRLSTSGEVAARLRAACDDIDVVELLPRVNVPTLVIHARKDCVVRIDQGRFLAANIPGARFVGVDSENHVPIAGEPAWDHLLNEIETFATEMSHTKAHGQPNADT
jgi:DNA-binding winged helix-turn-helix (wHTH) protein/alpha-beta hydrolase superfamily lysophospholipase